MQELDFFLYQEEEGNPQDIRKNGQLDIRDHDLGGCLKNKDMKMYSK